MQGGLMAAHPPTHFHRAFALSFFSSLLFLHVGSQSPPAPSAKMHTKEAAALNSMFTRWDLKPSWNTTDELCVGDALDPSNLESNIKLMISCDCSYERNTVCHVTGLKVYDRDVTGRIPDELQDLPFLNNLKLDQNYLTGPLPAFLGNFSEMQSLSIALNALSGTVPKELGKLTKLRLLSIGHNSFNSSLPPELGNLTNLQQVYINSAGLHGEIPSTFAQLQDMQLIWASDNDFTGKIPEFIGDMTNLTELRFQGNSFQGPIPMSLAKLTKLNSLRIGDLVNGSSSLAFIQNMTSLITLILRNCKISDKIPAMLGNSTSLQLLDLSFNNLTGEIPQSIFKYESLSFLFLGNNSLTGSLPNEKSEKLLNIDLSYNSLSGSFPSWVAQTNLQLNLVANNFVIDNSNNSILPLGLHCLQRNFPCNRDSPIYYSFAVNCGGTRPIISSDGTVYEKDDVLNFSSASYYVTNPTRWAVSSVGKFAEASNPVYLQYSSSQFSNTLDSEIFQSARLSPSSLRYYGIGLENGNYTVNLQFAETAFPDRPLGWKSVGRRVFDIYVQGTLMAKDFDIRKEAGGVSFRAVERKYSTNVTDNFLEIHFFWAGKGTCCIPTQGYYGPSISAISVTPNFVPTVSNKSPTLSSKKNKTGLVVGSSIGIAVLLTLLVLGIFIWRRKNLKHILSDDGGLLGLTVKANIFSYAELKTATGDFSPNNKLGEGGFGAVYKGILSDGTVVAVKQLSGTSRHGKRQFVTEIETISKVQHRNLVQLYGCCYEGDERLLVYEFLENKSLDQALFRNNSLHLDWPSRYQICLSTAKGLAYLHEESRPRIVHRDVKASNILLDNDLNPKISDFGLAKLYDDKKTHISDTRIAGTIGYLAPEYAMRGHLTEKADIFAFGIVALEILSGRPNADTKLANQQVYLLEWAWHLKENNSLLELVDPRLESYDKEEVFRVIGVALLCTQGLSSLRPPMSRVVNMLAGDIEVSEVTSKPRYLTEIDFRDTTSSLDFPRVIMGTDGTKRSESSFGGVSMTTSSPSPLATAQVTLGSGSITGGR